MSVPRIITLLLTVFSHCSVFSQLSAIGVGGGGAFSNFKYGEQISNVDQFDSTPKGGGTGGIRFDFDLGSDYLKLSPEFFVVQNGAKEYYNDFNALQNDLINRKVSLDYLGIYLPLTFYLPLSDNTETYNGLLLQGRVFADYVVNGQIRDNVMGTEDVKFKRKSDKFDYGYSFEAGFVVNGLKLMFGYNWGIKNIEFSNAIGDINSGNYLINNKGFTIQLGYLINIDK